MPKIKVEIETEVPANNCWNCEWYDKDDEYCKLFKCNGEWWEGHPRCDKCRQAEVKDEKLA